MLAALLRWMVCLLSLFISLSFNHPSLAFYRCVLMRAGSADGCEIELSVPPQPPLPPFPPPSQPPLTCKGFNDHEAGKHSKWQTLN